MEKSQIITFFLQKISSVIILTFFYGSLFGQANPPIWFQNVSSQTGFYQKYNYHLFQDSEGFVWISSTNGLNRFDGQRVKLYSPNEMDSTSLYDGTIYGKFFENSNKNIWFSSSKAIHQYNRKTDDFSHYFLKSNPSDSIKGEYHTFSFEDNRFLWLKTQDGIYKYDTHTDQDYFITNTSLYYVEPHVDTLGKLTKIFSFGNCEENSGIEIIDLKGSTVKKDTSAIFRNHNILNLTYINDSMIWLSSLEEGLVAWNPITDSRVKMEEFEKHDFKRRKCSFAKLDENNIIIIVEDQNIFNYNLSKDQMELIPYRVEGEKENKKLGLYKIYIDNNKNLWVSNSVNGVAFARWGKSKFASIPKFNSGQISSTFSFRTFIEDENDVVWCGTENGGVFIYDLNTKKVTHHFVSNSGLPDNLVWKLIKDKKNRIFLATAKGLALYQGGNKYSIINIQNNNKYSNGYFTSIIELEEDKNKDILVAEIAEGIFKLQENKGKLELVHIFKDEKLTEYESIFEDSKGNILITYLNQGIGIYSYQKEKLVPIKELQISDQVTSILEDDDSDVLWIATNNGLMKISTKNNYEGEPQKVTISGNSLGNIITTILPGNKNRDILWLGTNDGLVRMNKNTLAIQKFNIADGIQSRDFNFNSGLKRKNGDLWFGGFNGITIVPSNKIDSIKNIPNLKITNIKINDLNRNDLICKKTKSTNVNEIKHLSRDYQDNTISLEFTALEFSDPNSNQLEYQLVGVDKNPVRLKKGEYGFAKYPNLRPGDYHFNLRGANSDGVWGEVKEILMITIRPPFTQTKGFYFLMCLLFGAILYTIYHFRVKHIKKTEMLNTRIAENKMSALRAQMNPHFIFNSMQTVNGIISRKDTMGAVKYINQFSRLMRMILENSRDGLVSIDKEIDFLKSYMDIEKRRFQNPFTYNITVDDEVDTFDTSIPSMLTQPFVENAIKHGLFHNKEKGNIEIKFLRESGSLKCIIEDNGVGRAKSTELNTQSGRTHQSRGLQIVDERLELIRQSNPGNYKVKITDLFDLDQNASGTRVEITLPLKV